MKFSLYAAAFLFVLTLAVAAISVMTQHAHADDPVPCEDMLTKLRDAVSTGKPGDADAAKIKEFEDKGIGEVAVMLRHALRNAAVPVITVIGTGFALLISGVVVTESVFNIPGIGRLTVDAVLARDYPVIQAMILLTSLIYVTINLLIDVGYTLLDPRIRY